MKKSFKLFFLALFSATSIVAADDLSVSGKNEIFENPFVATGFNKSNNILTGSISVSRTAPGETNECRILFSGAPKISNALKIRYFELNTADGFQESSESDRAILVRDGASFKIKFDKTKLEGGCEWILSYIGAPSVIEKGNDLFLEVPQRKAGDWVSVHTIKAKRAYFYKNPEVVNAEKAFLVSGDTIYVYEERPDWFYVKFQGRKKQTVGWIRKKDTVQF